MRSLPRLAALLALALAGVPARGAECPNQLPDDGPLRGGDFTDPAAPPRPATGPDGALVVSFASYNVEYGEARLEALVEDLRRLEAARGPLDLILLQEVNGAPDGSTSAAEGLARALRRAWVWAPAHRRSGRDHGTAVLSRWPLSGARKIPLPDSPWVTCRRRAPLAVRAEVAGLPVEVYSVHLATVFPGTLWAEGGRADQLAPVLDDADRQPAEVAVLVAGDVNTVNPFGTRTLEARLRRHGFSPAQARGPGTARGWDVVLDRAWSRGFEGLLESGVDTGATGSDHFPIWGRLRGPPADGPRPRT